MCSRHLIRRILVAAALVLAAPLGQAADCRPEDPVAPARVLDAGECMLAARDPEGAGAWLASHAARLEAAGLGARAAELQGRIALARGDAMEARKRFEAGTQAADPGVAAQAGINLAVVAEVADRGALLDRALSLAQGAGRPDLQGVVLDRLAQWHEEGGRPIQAMVSNEAGFEPAGRTGRSDLLFSLQWRRGRLLRLQGDLQGALDAYRQAADHLVRIRQDIPVTFTDGRSSFRTTFAPVFQGLAELLLVAPGDPTHREGRLREVRRAMERVKQSELEDYLGDRCVPATSLDDADALPTGTVVVYPVMLADRLVLLVQRDARLEALTVAVPAQALGEVARRYARDLRSQGWTDTDAETLHGWLLAPVERLVGDGLKTLVIVPDASLRLFPFASLKRAGRYVIEDYAVAVAAGLGLAPGGPDGAGRSHHALLAGLALPGEVVERLPASVLRSFQDGALPAAPQARSAALKQALALPGVRDEIAALGRLGLGTSLVDEAFSLAGFESQVESGRYDLIHIASHGVFGGSAEETFIMAHDQVITIDRMRAVLSSSPRDEIALLTLSACETAEGDDRAPLGLAGAALRARARSALGSLWPVADDATRDLMTRFYSALLAGTGKAEALRQAQLAVMRSEGFSHPFFWSPFILVGDWR